MIFALLFLCLWPFGAFSEDDPLERERSYEEIEETLRLWRAQKPQWERLVNRRDLATLNEEARKIFEFWIQLHRQEQDDPLHYLKEVQKLDGP